MNRVAANITPQTKEQLLNKGVDEASLGAAYGKEVRRKLITNNTKLQNDLRLEGLDIDKQDITYNDIKTKLINIDDNLRKINFDKTNPEYVELQKSKKRLNKAKQLMRADIATYYDDLTGDFILPAYGYDDSFEALKAAKDPDKYLKYLKAAETSMNKALSKYTIGEDLIIEGDIYEEDVKKIYTW